MVRKILRNDQWERIEWMLPGKKSDRGQTAAANRLFVEAVLWIARTGSPWRDWPDEFGVWNSVDKRFGRCSDAKVWQRVFAELGKDADCEELFIDRTRVRAPSRRWVRPKKGSPSPWAFARRIEYPDTGGG
jgi:transposase